MALTEATRRVVLAGHAHAWLRSAERITDPDSGEAVWCITLQVSRRRKQSPKQT